MADLYKHDEQDRESWIRWAIEFMRRGIWPDDTITVHGPHDAINGMWGEAEGSFDPLNESCGVRTFHFQTARNVRKYHPRGVRIMDEDDNQYPILKISELSPNARRWLRAARRTLARH